MSFNSMGTGPRSRAGFATIKSSGGGAGPTLTALLAIGPDFGERAGSDDTTWFSETDGPVFDVLGFTLNRSPKGTQSLDALALEADLLATSILDIFNANFVGDLAESASLSLDAASFDFGTPLVGAGDLPPFDVLDLAGDLNDAGAIDLFAANFATDDNTRNDLAAEAVIDNLLYTPLGMNLREDSPDSQFIAAYTTGFVGTNPFLIRPETVAGVTNDERTAYFKWNLTGIDGDFDSYIVGAIFTVTNPSLVSSTTITMEMRSLTTEPFSSTPYSWNNYEPVTVGEFEVTGTGVVPANTTSVISVGTNPSGGLSARGDWMYVRVTSSLSGTNVQLASRDVDNNPLTFPHEAPYSLLTIDFT